MDALLKIKAAFEYIKGRSDVVCLVDIITETDVTGDHQPCDCPEFDHEYVEQRREFKDTYSGNICLPLPNGEYLKMYFCD